MQETHLVVHNTLTNKKEPFVSKEKGKVGMYVCGPTTYNFIHLGNARPLAVFDTVRRYLEYLGYQVTYIQNFTDVDDKIIKRAQEEGIEPLELAAKYVEEYFQDADALRVKRASEHPKVSGHMQEIITFVQQLMDKGYAYELDGDIYFAVARFKDYGKLSNRSLDALQAGARVGIDERKHNPADFALWKKAKPGEPSWESPWGQGRPGWHIECSAMSQKYLGATFDIHAGGYDLVFPHHENEIAQSEALHGEPMARYWLHNGFITVNQEKMSKSLGNFFLLRDILKKFPPAVVRFYLLATHYRSPLDFDDQKLDMAQKGLERLQTAYRLLQEKRQQLNELQTTMGGASAERSSVQMADQLEEDIQKVTKAFREAMNDDFNTALAMAALFDFAKAINIYISQDIKGAQVIAGLEKAEQRFRELADVMGLILDAQSDMLEDTALNAWVEERLRARQAAKVNKNYQAADGIRDELKEKGFIIEDTPQGPRWRRQ